jgi:hypothetical protein
MYGRPLQRKPAVRKPISFQWFELPSGVIERANAGEKQHEAAARLKKQHGSTTRLTPRYSR